MKYYVQQIASYYLRNLVPEPEAGSVTVDRDFLQGFDIEEFRDGYLTLLRLVRSMYTDVMNEPGAFGMPLMEAVEENSKSTNYTKSHDGFKRIPHILLILGVAGKITANMTLTVSGGDLITVAKSVKLVKMPEMLNKLKDYGFEITGFTKQVKEGDALTVSYPDCRAVLPVLKSMADAQSIIAKGDIRRNNAYFYMMMPDILKSSKVKEPVLTFGDMYRALNDNNREIAVIFNECIGNKAKVKFRTIDFMRNRWHGVYTGIKSKQVLCTIKNEHDDLSVKMNLEHIGTYMDTVMALPEGLQKEIRENAWNCNQSQCNPKCAGGFKFEMDGEKYSKCRGGAFTFTNIAPDDAEHLKLLLEHEMKREV